MAAKWHQKSISTLKAENQQNVSWLAFSWVSGVEVGSKNRPKIDPKMESKVECMLASTFDRFWWILGPKLGQAGGKLALNRSKKAWAFPHRSRDVPRGSRARIIDFSMVFGGLGG